MTNLNSLQHSITAAIGALFISTLFVVAAVGPVSPAAASQTAIALVSPSAQANA
jgi:hypothetical protein